MTSLKYVGVVLLAGTVGAAIALLVAPESGEVTRRRIRKRLDRERNRLMRKGRAAMEDAGEFLEDQVDAGRKVIEAQVQTGKKAIEEAAESVIDQLEHGRKSVAKLVHA
jgi:gas vesicle protein